MAESNEQEQLKDNPERSASGQKLSHFMFATGIENSYPTIALPDNTYKRIDEMAKCNHYHRWREDFELVKDLGIEFLRYGPPYFSTHAAAGRYDWEFADETFAALRSHSITPIADLCHFGVPDWIGSFQNPDWPELFAEYARSFAERFSWVRFFTPVNEISIAATFSALFGWWNERLKDERSYVNALKHLCKANTLAMRAILEVQPAATFIQSETTEYYHAKYPKCVAQADVLNERRFLAFDLSYGNQVNAETYQFLLDNGMTREEYQWFFDNHVKSRCVMGNDYYITNEHFVEEDESITGSGEIFGYYVITHQYFQRYGLPVMHTETNLMDSDRAPDWLRKEWANMHRLKLDGVPVIGFTWYSLTDQVDWDTALREDNGIVNPLGLFDLDRNIRPVGQAYKQLIENWRAVLPTESSSLSLHF